MNVKRCGFLFTFLTLSLLAQTPNSPALDAWRNTGLLDPFTAIVKVTVSSDDNLEAEVSSYISRELRSLQGIQVSDKGQNFELSIVAMRVPRDRPQIVALSYLFTRVLLAEKAVGIRNALKPEMVSVFDHVYREVHTLEGFGVVTFAQSADLKQQCQKLVAQFDAKVLEPQRKSHEEFREQIMKRYGH